MKKDAFIISYTFCSAGDIQLQCDSGQEPSVHAWYMNLARGPSAEEIWLKIGQYQNVNVVMHLVNTNMCLMFTTHWNEPLFYFNMLDSCPRVTLWILFAASWMAMSYVTCWRTGT